MQSKQHAMHVDITQMNDSIIHTFQHCSWTKEMSPV